MRARLGFLLLLFVCVPATGQGLGSDHADVGVSPSFGLFPQHAEVVAALISHADHPWVTLHEVGASSSGAPILMAEVVRDDSPVPIGDRVVTLLITQQHGNEPAGTPAALDLLETLLTGAGADALENQVLLVLPMANPDGAAAERRANANGTDLNRDHIGLEEPETRALHRVLRDWDVHVAMDHHEYGGQGFGNPVPVRVYDYDLTTLFPVHESVRAATDRMARELMYEGIWPAAAAAGYSANEYGEQTLAGIPIQQLAGGPDPGILRNNFGLHNIAGLLVETRVDAHPNPFHDAERRTDIHRVVMDATLEYASAKADAFIAAKRASEAANVEDPLDQYMEGEARQRVPDLYGVSGFEGLDEIVDLQGLEASGDAQHLYPSAQARGGLVSATFNPGSSRAVSGVVMVDVDESSLATTTQYFVPGMGFVAVAAAVVVAALARRR